MAVDLSGVNKQEIKCICRVLQRNNEVDLRHFEVIRKFCEATLSELRPRLSIVTGQWMNNYCGKASPNNGIYEVFKAVQEVKDDACEEPLDAFGFLSTISKLIQQPRDYKTPTLCQPEINLLKKLLKCNDSVDQETKKSTEDIFAFKFHEVPAKDTISSTELEELIANESKSANELLSKGLKKRKQADF